MNVRPLHDWILVQLDPLPEESKVGSIFVLGSDVERVRTALVVRVGPGRRHGDTDIRIPHFVRPLTRIAFFREHLEHQQGKQILAALEDGYGLIRAMDVLGEVIDETDDALRDAFGFDEPHAELSPAKEVSAEEQAAFWRDDDPLPDPILGDHPRPYPPGETPDQGVLLPLPARVTQRVRPTPIEED